MSLGGVLTRAEAFQGPVHAGGAHAETHRREASQMHSKNHSRVREVSVDAHPGFYFYSLCAPVPLKAIAHFYFLHYIILDLYVWL